MSFDGYFSGDRVEYVYLMATPCLPGWVKIGRSNNPERRRRELSTAVPEPFYIEALLLTDDPIRAEAILHQFMQYFRTDSNAEFFRVERSVLLEEDEFGGVIGVEDSIEYLVDELNSVLDHQGINAMLCLTDAAQELRSMYSVTRRRYDTES